MMSRRIGSRLLLVLLAALALAGCERPPVDSEQRGYRGLAMGLVSNPRIVATSAALNAAPAAIPALPGGTATAKETFKNVQVLGELSVGEFTRTMLAITAWVSPKEGCNYCHVPGEDLSKDTLYTKVVSRKMLEMTRHINGKGQNHVAATGVTCYTCHRGRAVPPQVWFTDPGPRRAGGASADSAGQNIAAMQVGLTALPYDPLTPFLLGAQPIRVLSKAALPDGSNRMDIKQTEATYGLMTHVSQALGVNCTFCHNSRSFAEWEGNPQQRVTAFYGIGLTRELNTAFMVPLTASFPPARLGPLGDVAKIGCATCHNGVAKPLNGAPMAKDHADAMGWTAPPPKPVAATAAPAELALATGPGKVTRTP